MRLLARQGSGSTRTRSLVLLGLGCLLAGYTGTAGATGASHRAASSDAYRRLHCPADGSSCAGIIGGVGTSSPAVSSARLVVMQPPPPSVSVTILSIAGPRMRVRVICPGVDGQLCTGQLTLTSQARVHGRTVVAVTARRPGHVITIALGHASFAVPAPHFALVSMTIDAAGRRLLDEFYRLPAQLTFPGTVLPPRTVTFEYPVIGHVLSYTASWRPLYTTMRRFAATRLPAHARVQVRCRGPGCPFHQYTSRPTGTNLDLTYLFRGAHLLPTATLYAAVTAPNMVGDALLMRIRDGAPPQVTKLCVVPGVRTAHPCRGAG